MRDCEKEMLADVVLGHSVAQRARGVSAHVCFSREIFCLYDVTITKKTNSYKLTDKLENTTTGELSIPVP